MKHDLRKSIGAGRAETMLPPPIILYKRKDARRAKVYRLRLQDATKTDLIRKWRARQNETTNTYVVEIAM